MHTIDPKMIEHLPLVPWKNVRRGQLVALADGTQTHVYVKLEGACGPGCLVRAIPYSLTELFQPKPTPPPHLTPLQQAAGQIAAGLCSCDESLTRFEDTNNFNAAIARMSVDVARAVLEAAKEAGK